MGMRLGGGCKISLTGIWNLSGVNLCKGMGQSRKSSKGVGDLLDSRGHPAEGQTAPNCGSLRYFEECGCLSPSRRTTEGVTGHMVG